MTVMSFSQITIIIKQVRIFLISSSLINSLISRSFCIQCSSLQETEQKNTEEDSKWKNLLVAGKHLNLGARGLGVKPSWGDGKIEWYQG